MQTAYIQVKGIFFCIFFICLEYVFFWQYCRVWRIVYKITDFRESVKMLYDDFKRLGVEYYELFHQYSVDFAGESCERAWANLMLYCDTYDWHFSLSENRLWIVSFKEAYIFFPLGDFIAPEELGKHYQKFLQCVDEESVIGDVPEKYLTVYPAVSDIFKLELDPGEADYIYDLEHLQSFSGSKLRKRHNQVRQFDREYENCWKIESITFDMLDEIIEFAARQSNAYWSDDTGLEECLAFGKLKSVWQMPSSGLAGIALYVKNSLAGFSVYSSLNKVLADIHFEKADHSYRGCGAKLTGLLVDDLLNNGYAFMNREQDLNDPGLRRAKQALDPDHLWNRYSITGLK